MFEHTNVGLDVHAARFPRGAAPGNLSKRGRNPVNLPSDGNALLGRLARIV
jgi:hypothetical protein